MEGLSLKESTRKSLAERLKEPVCTPHSSGEFDFPVTSTLWLVNSGSNAMGKRGKGAAIPDASAVSQSGNNLVNMIDIAIPMCGRYNLNYDRWACENTFSYTEGSSPA